MGEKTRPQSAYLKLAGLTIGITVIISSLIYYIRAAKVSGIREGATGKITNSLTIPQCLQRSLPDRSFVKVGDWLLALARTDSERSQGLSGVPCLADEEGMLFIFNEPYEVGIWMKDMLMSLDIIWLDENGVVIHIENSVSPNTYPKIFTPASPAKYVIELKSGIFAKSGIEKGTKINLPDNLSKLF